MSRRPQPWLRHGRGWYVQHAGKQVALGRDKKLAFKRFHDLMSSPERAQVAHREDSFLAVCDTFLDWTQQNRAERTYDWYVDRLQSFVNHLVLVDRLIAADRVQPFHVAGWLDHHANWSPTTRRASIIAVQRCFRWAEKMGYITRSPMRSLDKPRAEARDRIVTPDEYQTVLKSAADTEFRDLIVTAWETGCRPQELLRAEARHFDSRNVRWVFPPKEAKGKKRPRIVYLTKPALAITERLVATHRDGPMFRNTQGRPWTAYAVNCRFTRIRKKHSLHLCLYHFRHTFATRMLESGLDALTVALLLGHANPTMLAEALAPDNKSANHDENAAFWRSYAQMLIEAIIISLQNAAEKANLEPTWTLRDLFDAVESRDTLEDVLQHHDRPTAMLSQFLDLPASQRDSILLSGRKYLARFAPTAELWLRAAREGRSIRLKEWAKSRPGTVLVLPDTQKDTRAYEPLNQAIFKTLSNLFLTHEYSSYTNADGNPQVRRRYIFLDEFGDAGRLPDFERLMTKGRDFGVNVVIAFQQQSQIKKTYGEDDMLTILNQCGHTVFLKQNDPNTQKWMSDYIGEQLIAYPKEAFAHAVSHAENYSHARNKSLSHAVGKNESLALAESATQSETNTKSTNGSRHTSSQGSIRGGGTSNGWGLSDAATQGSGQSTTVTNGRTSQDSATEGDTITEGHVDTVGDTNTTSIELRKEPACYGSYFGGLPNPRTAKKVGGIYTTTSMAPWPAVLTFEDLAPDLICPLALHTVPETDPWEDANRRVRTSSWDAEDYERLGINRNRTFVPKPLQTTASAAPSISQPIISRIGDTEIALENSQRDDSQTSLPADFGWNQS